MRFALATLVSNAVPLTSAFFYTVFSVLAAVVWGPADARAQAPPVEWGEVPRADLEMQTYPADTNATAVVLADYSEVSFKRRTLKVRMERHTRIKILSKAGYDHERSTRERHDRLREQTGLPGSVEILAADFSAAEARRDTVTLPVHLELLR